MFLLVFRLQFQSISGSNLGHWIIFYKNCLSLITNFLKVEGGRCVDTSNKYPSPIPKFPDYSSLEIIMTLY